MECARYVERNPLEAHLVQKLEDYPYSSYAYYANGRKDELLTENPVFETLGETAEARRAAYSTYVSFNRPEVECLEPF
jgi:putative transposase